MKKILLSVMSVTALVFFTVGCSRENPEEKPQEATPSATEETKAGVDLQKITKKDNAPFTFTFMHEKRLCTLGIFKSGLPVTLLQKTPCRAKTGQAATYIEEDFGEIEFTPIIPSTICEISDDSAVALIGQEVKNFEIIPTKTLDDKQLMQAWDAKIKKSDAFKELLARDGFPPERLDSFISESLSFVGFNDKAVNGLIAICGKNGPRVLVIKDTIFKLTGPCSYDKFRLFRLNDELYLESGSMCCECGVTGQELFKITPKGTEIAYADYSWSD